ncbi:MAG: beta-hydroxyacyl-ACP dehydratase [Rhodocyclaceae bacterium]|nr:MAG: beta-hydroxyacyl-ACP dehydratase [Rhodocyclaceae bacterium]
MMSQLLPEILGVRHLLREGGHVVLSLHIPANIVHFSDHFPGMAILPGVVQIDWAIRFAGEYFALTSGFTMIENIKFQALILPDARLDLDLHWNGAAKESFEFSFATSQRMYSHGRIVFGART